MIPPVVAFNPDGISIATLKPDFVFKYSINLAKLEPNLLFSPIPKIPSIITS